MKMATLAVAIFLPVPSKQKARGKKTPPKLESFGGS
jgi:hypothetical protein